MRARKRFLLGALLAILAGSALATVAANLDRGAADAPPVDVATGHFGDAVVYARYLRPAEPPTALGTTSWLARPLPGSDAEPAATYLLTLKGPVSVVDSAGTHREAVRVRWAEEPGGSARSLYGGYDEPAALREVSRAAGSGNATMTVRASSQRSEYFVSHVMVPMAAQVGEDVLLEDRSAARWEHELSRGERVASPGPPGTPSGTIISAVDERTAVSDFAARAAQTFFLRYQGRTLRLGDELVPTMSLDRFHYWAVGPALRVPIQGAAQPKPYQVWHEGTVFPDVASITYREWVADHGRVDGREALGVRAVVTIEARRPALNGLEPGPWATIEIRLRAWMVDGEAYPVLIETDHDAYALARVEPGATPLAWGDTEPALDPAPADRSPRVALPDLPALASSGRPTDGDGAAWPYRLEKAFQDATAAPELTGYRAWLLNHTDAVLVGAHYAVNDSHPQPYAWHLLHAAPAGDGYEVVLRRDAASPLAAATDRGPRTVPSFDAGGLPETTRTLADVARLWRSLAAADGAAADVNSIHWGYEAWSEVPAFDTTRCTATFEVVARWRYDHWNPFRTPQPLAEARVGHYALSPCGGDRPREEATHATLDLETGAVLDYRAKAREHGVHLAGAREARVPPALAAATLGLRPPDLVVATVASGSLLLLVAAVYLAPALKYAATQAVVVLPGYSKLKRSALLDNRVRDRLVTAIREDPGVDATELKRRAQVAWGTVVYHLTVLERHKLVSSLLDGGHRRFFPVGEVDWSRRGQIGLLRNERARALYEAIAQEPGVIQEALAHRMGMSSPGVLWHLSRLEEAGLVGRVKEGRKVHYYANATGYPQAPYDPDEAVEVS